MIPYRYEITDLAQNGYTANGVRNVLFEKYGVTVSKTELNSYITRYGDIRPPKLSTDEIERLVADLSRQLNTKELLLVLKRKDMKVSSAGSKAARTTLGTHLATCAYGAP